MSHNYCHYSAEGTNVEWWARARAPTPLAAPACRSMHARSRHEGTAEVPELDGRPIPLLITSDSLRCRPGEAVVKRRRPKGTRLVAQWFRAEGPTGIGPLPRVNVPITRDPAGRGAVRARSAGPGLRQDRCPGGNLRGRTRGWAGSKADAPRISRPGAIRQPT